jgi:rod shape determining protein RodA
LRVQLLHFRKGGLLPHREVRALRGPGALVLERVWRQLALASNWPVLVAVFALSAVGVVSIWADNRGDAIKQLIFFFVGLAGMGLFQAINYQVLGRFVWGFYVFSLVLICYTVLGSIADAHHITLPGAHPIKGQCNWINLKLGTFVFSLQPAELTKIAFVGVMARYLRFRNNYRTLRGLLPPFGLALLPLVLILKQPDLGTALVFIPVLFVMLFVAGAKLRHLAAVAALGTVMAPVLWMAGTNVPVFRHLPPLIKGYQRERVYAMFSNDPKTLRETGFQQEHALIALGSGGLGGKGFGNIPVGQSVPEAHNDMIFSLVGEQFGFFGVVAVLGAYIVLFAAGIEIAGNTREPFGRLLAVGIVSMLAGQTFINLMVATKLMPVTGITLPFVSYGGSSLLASFLSAGLLLNVGQNRPLIMARDSFEFDRKPQE